MLQDIILVAIHEFSNLPFHKKEEKIIKKIIIFD